MDKRSEQALKKIKKACGQETLVKMFNFISDHREKANF